MTLTEPLSIQKIRQLRQAADVLADSADWCRLRQIEQLGLKRYIFNALGAAARQPAASSRLLWSDNVESVPDVKVSLGEYLFQKAQAGQALPQAVVVGGEKFYL